MSNKLQVLSLMDGRLEDDEQSSIYCGPVVTGITKLAYCGLTIRLYFDSQQSLMEAKRQTGWEQYSDQALIMSGFDDYVVTRERIDHSSDQKTNVYYGDWYIEAAG